MSPQITLGIDIVKYPNVAAEAVTEFNQLIKSNEQELNRQVFSLLILKNFSPQGSFTGISNSGSNISELLSNQLSNWLSQVDNNLQIDVDLNSLDKQALNTFQLRMSYTLLDGRLKISRDGGFTNTQTTQANNVTNIAGEWTLEYLLNQDGTLRMKLYNKNNQNPLLTSLVNTYNTSAGFSLLHTQSFNSLNELFKKKPEHKKKKKEEEAEQQKNQEDSKKNNKSATEQGQVNRDIHRKEDTQEEGNE